jgi:hypothetical protein
MSTLYTFTISFVLTNEEELKDGVMEMDLGCDTEEDLLFATGSTEPLVLNWSSAHAMGVERSEGGQDWKVEVSCTKVIRNLDGASDWDEDMMPQRADVTELLNDHMNNFHRQVA